jgi:15-cis-phytoene synthase
VTAVLADSAAIRYCEAVTRREAKNFWYGIRLLPATKRRVLAAVYAMSRRVDDIGDGRLPVAEKWAALAEVKRSLENVHRGSDDPILAALGESLDVCPLPLEAFCDLVDGVLMDVEGTSFESFDDLLPYCRRVAGSVGRLSLAVFFAGDVAAPEAFCTMADDLGVALQLTNILRDIREDLGNGRVYLPAEDLQRFGADLQPGRALDSLPGDHALHDVMRFEAGRAFAWYAKGLQLLPLLDRRSAASAGAMAGIYLRLLEQQIVADPAAALRQRQSLPGKAKAMVAVRALAGIAERVPATGYPATGNPATGNPATGNPTAGDTPAGGPA